MKIILKHFEELQNKMVLNKNLFNKELKFIKNAPKIYDLL